MQPCGAVRPKSALPRLRVQSGCEMPGASTADGPATHAPGGRITARSLRCPADA